MFVATQVVVVTGVLVIVSAPLVYSTGGSTTSTPYQVLKENLTLQPGPVEQDVDCGIRGIFCSPDCCVLNGVSLISFEDTDYYVYSDHHTGTTEEVTITVASTISAGETSTSYLTTLEQNPSWSFTTWFTNSSIYCISPSGDWSYQLPTCPE